MTDGVALDSAGRWLQIIGAKVSYNGSPVWVRRVYDGSHVTSDGSRKRYMEVEMVNRRIDLSSCGHHDHSATVPLTWGKGWSNEAAPAGCEWAPNISVIYPSPRLRDGDKVHCVCCKDRGIVEYAQESSNEWITVRWYGGHPDDCNRASVVLESDTMETNW